MKIVCLCQKGNSRSAALAYLLQKMGHEAIPIGLYTASRGTRKMLYDWADRIILTYRGKEHWIPPEYSSKLKIWDVGKDVYFRGYSEELLGQFRHYLDTEGL
jgi:hypothetical protein